MYIVEYSFFKAMQFGLGRKNKCFLYQLEK